MNAIQDAINRIVSARYSLAAVVVDGTGGSVVAPVAGTVKVSATASATAFASTDIGVGQIYRDAVVVGWCSEDRASSGAGGGVLDSRYYNVNITSRRAQGKYRVDFNYAPTDGPMVCIEITPAPISAGLASGTPVSWMITDQTTSGGKLRVDFEFSAYTAGAWALEDMGFRVLAIGY